jgi:hypothetical protein
MADKSELYKSVLELEKKLRRSVEGRAGSSGKLRQLKLSLLQVLELDCVDPTLARAAGRVRGGKTLLNTIKKRVEANKYAVLKAIYDHVHMGTGLRSACSRWGCRPSDAIVAKELAQALGRRLGSFTDDLLELGCLADVVADREEVVVYLSHRALEDMVLATLEGYQVPKTLKSRFTEVYGLCLGMVRDDKLSRKGGGKYWRRHVYVQQAPVQIRAKATKDHVWPNSRSLATQLEAAKVLFPHLEVIGDFHSHPYQSARNIRRGKKWEPTEDDEDFNYGWIKTMRDYHHNPRVGFIIAIGKQKRASRDMMSSTNSNVCFKSIGGNLIAISVYRILQDASYETEATAIKLRIPELART